MKRDSCSSCLNHTTNIRTVLAQ